MTDQEIRIAVAEVAGWKRQRGTPIVYGGTHIKSGWLNKKGKFYTTLPDYTNDLNAIREAVMVQSKDVQKEFAFNLTRAYLRKGRNAIHQLTARDWCEALLRAMGKWIGE